MLRFRTGWLGPLTAAGLLAGLQSLFGAAFPIYVNGLKLDAGNEWRFQPLVVDVNRDGNLDVVATARLVHPALHIWLGDGKGTFTPQKPTSSDIGYAALATADVNGDGFPDIVAASHFGAVQTLLSDGRGGFTEKVFKGDDGYVAAEFADVNEDRHPDLILVGYQKVGIEVYLGDGAGNWMRHIRLPESQPGATMPGRALLVGDLNHDGHVDLVAAFQLWGIYIYYGDGHDSFTGGAVNYPSANREFQSLALADVNHDGHPDIVINGTLSGDGKPDGPDVYLGDGRTGWKASSIGLKALKSTGPGIAVADLDRDGNPDIIAAGSMSGEVRDGYGVFWFRGDGRGGWSRVEDCGLPTRGLSVPYGVRVADIDNDGTPEIIVLSGSRNGSIAIWRRQAAHSH